MEWIGTRGLGLGVSGEGALGATAPKVKQRDPEGERLSGRPRRLPHLLSRALKRQYELLGHLALQSLRGHLALQRLRKPPAVEWSRVAWSGVVWSAVEWSGMRGLGLGMEWRCVARVCVCVEWSCRLSYEVDFTRRRFLAAAPSSEPALVALYSSVSCWLPIATTTPTDPPTHPPTHPHTYTPALPYPTLPYPNPNSSPNPNTNPNPNPKP